jgi:small-conductance mechanosensitive channel
MEKAIQNALKWLEDPVLSKLAGTLVAVVVVVAIVQVIKRVSTRYIDDKSVRYRARKAIGFIGYLLGALVVLAMFSDRLGRLSVVFGVAGAGIAFALQEVIVSVAGWAAVSFGSFYTVGDRIQLGGIKGDVIDIGVFSARRSRRSANGSMATSTTAEWCALRTASSSKSRS